MHRNLYISNFEVTEMMWKEIGSIVKKLILLLFPFFLLLPLYCMLFPENYLDGEYAMYRQQQDFWDGRWNNKNTGDSSSRKRISGVF